MEYDLDDEAIDFNGSEVQCTVCGHTFKVYRPSSIPPPAVWYLTEPDGSETSVESLDVLIKWATSGRVSPDDLVRAGNGPLVKLADIPALRPAFRDRGTWPGVSKSTIPPAPSSFVPPAPMSHHPSVPPPPHVPQGARRDAIAPTGEQTLKTEQPSTAADIKKADSAELADALSTLPPPKDSKPAAVKDVPIPRTMVGSRVDSQKALWIAFSLVFFVLGAVGIYFLNKPETGVRASKKAPVSTDSQKAPSAVRAARMIPQDDNGVENNDDEIFEEEVVSEVTLGEENAAEETGDTEKPAAAKRINPQTVSSVDSILARAEVLQEIGNTSEAITMYKKVLEEEPYNSEAVTGLAFSYLDRGDRSRAITTFRRAVSVNPSYGPALIGLGEALYANGKKRLAVDYFRKYLESSPNGKHAYLARKKIEESGNAVEPAPAASDLAAAENESDAPAVDTDEEPAVKEAEENTSQFGMTESERNLLKVVGPE